VLSAKQAGYTEPDPRDDLNGLDVARKMLILAREAGCQMEMTAVEVENLISAECRAAKSVEEFFLRLKELDGYFEDRRRRAAEVGRKLCYIARLASGRVNVALKEIDSSHPFYGLSGSENIISFTTKRYSNRPLVVKGPGAGAEVTAAGVFADILRLAS
jgi:aspartokinase/homoserine dehydrogenase 1